VLREGLAETRSQASGLIRAGKVLVDDTPVDKPGTRVREESAVRVRGEVRRFVSRGGDKLDGALADLGFDPQGRLCLDVGASTGGFCDRLLQGGARAVVAVDVGYGQLAESLRQDPRVTVLERTHARDLDPGALPFVPDLVTMDVSFIAARLVLPHLARVAPAADWLVLVKPQFELGRERVGKGGVVRDDADRREAADSVAAEARSLGWDEQSRVDSRVPGPKGNREIFLWLAPRGADEPDGGVPGGR
jgi:23S rRNA (cytidine1920-2'-O)/16S rRNA (cytidine1409-2'-O)-methyltransferase